ncbi:MAG: endolytic transglycosylase MltG [Candidatus Eisenbacteria bacterium]|nr:endolytic transglycosylase MltG [Candidatus Eisenbacteria bacterium]
MTRRRTFRPSRWALLLLIAAGLAVAADLFVPAGLFPTGERRVILIQRGETLRRVADELQRVGLLHGTLGFLVLARAMQLDRSIRAGEYSFKLGTTVPALLRALARGMSGLNLVTIPEGLTTQEVSLLLSNHLGVPIAEFDSLAHDRAFLDSLGISAPSIEGYLAPESYEFLPGTAPEVAFRTMARRTIDQLLRAAAGRDSLPLGLSLHQVLTLASIVEAEAQVNEDRPRIARVYLNRLQQGMRLQADPTVGYALGSGPLTRLSLRQLRISSPFNTYLYEGLPPGPICNPGRASIAAVIDPLPVTFKDLYFVADGRGHHVFAETYKQHLANIRRVRAPDEEDEAPPLMAHLDTTATHAAKAAKSEPKAAGKSEPKTAGKGEPKTAGKGEPKAGKPAPKPRADTTARAPHRTP